MDGPIFGPHVVGMVQYRLPKYWDRFAWRKPPVRNCLRLVCSEARKCFSKIPLSRLYKTFVKEAGYECSHYEREKESSRFSVFRLIPLGRIRSKTRQRKDEKSKDITGISRSASPKPRAHFACANAGSHRRTGIPSDDSSEDFDR